jgi:hypothetical protein
MARVCFFVRLIVGFVLFGSFVGFFLGARAVTSQQPSAADAPESIPDVTRVTMRGIFTAFTNVYSYSLNMEYFSDRRNRETVSASLDALVANTSELRAHGGGLDRSFDYLRRTLASDAEEALKRYEEGEYLGSQFMLNKLMENCAMCHTRLSSDQAFEVGGEFLKKVRAHVLAPVDRVNVEVAARQFGAALATYEEILASSRIPAEGLMLTGAVEGYLRLCIGVRNETQRPARTFDALARRSDAPAELRRQAEAWIRDLGTLDLPKAKGHEIETARGLVGDAGVSNRPPQDRSDLVRMVAANSLIRRHLQSLSSYDDEGAEAFYLLAVTESRASRSYWSAEVDFLLEQAVRSAPKTEYARRALSALEERSKTPPPTTAFEGQQAPTIDIEELRKLVAEG